MGRKKLRNYIGGFELCSGSGTWAACQGSRGRLDIDNRLDIDKTFLELTLAAPSPAAPPSRRTRSTSAANQRRASCQGSRGRLDIDQIFIELTLAAPSPAASPSRRTRSTSRLVELVLRPVS